METEQRDTFGVEDVLSEDHEPEIPSRTEDGEASDTAKVYKQQQALELENVVDKDIVGRAKQYVAKKKEELHAELMAKFSDKMTTFDAIKCFQSRSLMACNLTGQPPAPAPELGTFFSATDGRMAGCELRVSFACKTAISYSFEVDTLMCKCCALDKRRILSTYKSETTASRVAFWLSDQCGPASLASLTAGQLCIPVIRMESGMLKELAEEFLGLTAKYKLNPGTVVIISSATQLAIGGIAEYVRDLATITGWFSHRYFGEVEVIPGPIININGSDSLELARGELELLSWCRIAGGVAGLLCGTMQVAIEANKSNREETGTKADRRAYRMPASLSGEGGVKPWTSGDLGDISGKTRGLSVAQERTIITTMRTELATGHGLQLGELQSDRGIAKEQERAAAAKKKYLVIGASNSCRLSAALQNQDITVGRITTTNWKPSAETVEVMASHVTNGCSIDSPDTVVFELLDNLLYLGRNEDGTTTLPTRGQNGVYHVKGALYVAHKETQYHMYKTIRPLLMAAGNRPMVIITPFPRYVSAPCCADRTHITNFRDINYTDEIMASLADIRTNFKSFLFADRIRRVNVINPAPLMDDRLSAEHWQDPVHPKEDSFRQLATLVMEAADRLAGKRKLEEEADQTRGSRGGWSGHTRERREWHGPLAPRSTDGERGGRGGHRWTPRGGRRGGHRGGQF